MAGALVAECSSFTQQVFQMMDSMAGDEQEVQRTVEQTQKDPVPQVIEHIVEAVRMIPQERGPEWPVEQAVDVRVPQVVEVAVEMVSISLQERI